MKSTTLLISGAVLALAGSAPALQAQDVRYGLQIHGNVPMGDLKDAADSQVGFGGGAHMTIDFGDGHVLRPRLDYVVYPENEAFTDVAPGNSAYGKSKVSDASLGVDYIYDFGGKDGGFYLIAGLAWHRWKAEYEVGSNLVSLKFSTTSSKLGVAAGAGFNFNPSFGVEARYVATKFQQGTEDRTAGAVQVAALYRF